MTRGDAAEATTLVDMLRRRVERDPTLPVFTFLPDDRSAPRTFTFAEIERSARCVAARVLDRSAVKEHAALVFETGPDFVAAFFGCLIAGVVPVPVPPPRRRGGDERLRAVMADARPSVVLTDTATADRVAPSLPDTAPIAVDRIDDQPLDWSAAPGVDPDDLALLQYTSGSTSAPRGVMVSHRNLLRNSASICRRFGHSSETVGVSWLPCHHDMGLIGGVIQPMFAGFHATMMSPASFLVRPHRWLEAISGIGPVSSGGPNFAYDLCVRRTTPEQRATLDLGGWTVAYNSAEPICADTLDRFARAFEPCGFRREALCPGYGLAEATLMVTASPPGSPPIVRARSRRADGHVGAEEPIRAVVSSGTPGDGVAIAIVDPETGVRCGSEEIGEIWVAGDGVALGYHAHPEEFRSVFGARLGDERGAWLRTGDLGFERDGELFVTGRLKDLIIVAGRNHDPSDVERTVESGLDMEAFCRTCVFSIESDATERVVVVIERARPPEPVKTGGADAGVSIRRIVTEHHDLSVHEIRFVRRGAIPRTTSGKIRRRACREAFLAGDLIDWSEA